MSADRKSLGQLLTAAVREFGIAEEGIVSVGADADLVTVTTYRRNAEGHRFVTESGEAATETHVQCTHHLPPHHCSVACTDNGPAAPTVADR